MKITKPTLLLDETKCRENIKFMVSKARNNKIEFRPHFKTHQSLEIGRWFKEEGVNKITVSSLEMAEFFSKVWNDITVAFPVNILEIETINNLAAKITLNLLVESEESITFLNSHLNSNVGYFIKIDLGSHRTGLDPADFFEIDKILNVSHNSELLIFKGFLGHAGQTYSCNSKKEIVDIQNYSLNIMKNLKEKYIEKYPDLIISIGDTPGCSVSDDFKGADEIRPGNFIFYDLMQLEIGSCAEEQIAVAMACPVVAVHKDRNEMVVYGGGIHFSKDRMEDKKFRTIYGRAAENCKTGWGKLIPDMYLKNISQEHGILSVPKDRISNYRIGDVIIILPVHSCMTADVMKCYMTLEGRLISMMRK